MMNVELGGKRLELLHELLPKASRVSVLVNPKSPLTAPFLATVQAAAAGRQYEILTASTNREIDVVFGKLVQEHADALLISGDALFTNRCVQLAILAARHAVPAIHSNREFAEAGGLMSYGPNVTELFRLIPAAFSREKSPPTCRWYCQPSLSLSSTCKQPKRSGSMSRRRYSPAPTR
jgi:putative ABC transport system substrate-binding protein